jgi:hypothetical protein
VDEAAEKAGFDDEHLAGLFGEVCNLLFACKRIGTDESESQYIHLYKNYLFLHNSINLKGF